MVTMPACSNSSLRSLTRTSAVSRPSRSSRSRVSPNRAPRGTAMRSSGIPGPGSTLLAGQRDMESFDVEREPDRGQGQPESPQQLVVATAAADRHPMGWVVDLKHRAGVVTEAPDQAEVEDDPLRRAGR